MTKSSTYQGHAFGIAAAITILAIVLLAGEASAEVIQVNINITNNNDINIQSNGDINVDILSSPDFNAPARVNISTVTFMGAPANRSKNDNNNTISLKFHVQNTVIQCVDLRGYLFGTTYDGQTIYGSDIIHIKTPASQGCTSGTGPNITFFDPPYSPVTNNVSELRNFSIKVNQTVNVFWYIGINGNPIQANGSVIESTYTNNSASLGGWNVIVYANNSNGSDVQSWGWIVSKVNTSISVNSSQNPSAFGQPVTFTAIVAPVAPVPPGAGTPTGTVKFFNGSTLLGTVPLSGLSASLTNSSLGIGNNSITAVYSGDNNFSTSTSPAITQTVVKVNKVTPIITWSNPADITYGTALNSIQLNASASYNGSTVPGNFTYTPSNGTVLSAGTNILQANFTPTDTENYTNASVDVNINVSKASPTITWNNPPDITYGTALNETQLNASASVDGSFTYTPASGTVLGAGNNQNLHADFTPTDAANYTTASADVNIDVKQATPMISWSNPADIIYGTVLSGTQLDASASVDGTFVYTPSNSTVLSAGIHTLQANFTPTDTMNYTNASKNVTINISKADQTITWSNPADIVYGTALSDTQLNAVVTAIGPAPAGALTYAPPAGTILSAGDGQTLSVTAATTDNYTEANDTVTINVTKASQTITFDALGNKTYGDAPFDVSATASSGLPVSFTASGECTVSGNNVTITGAGICTITANQSGNANYNPAPDLSQSFNIVEASQTITFNALADKTYGDAPFTVSATASSGLPVSFSASGTCTVSDSTVTITGAGACTITAHQAGDANYNAAPEVSQTFSIAKATASIAVTPYSVTYDGNVHTATVVATGAKGEDLSADVDLSNTTHTNAGDYPSDPWTFTDSTGNYNSASGTVHDSISKIDATITVNGYTGVYDGNSQGASGTATGVGGTDLSASLNLGSEFTNVPGGTAHWTFTGDTNYNDANGDVNIEISKADMSISVIPYSVTYDGNAHTATGTATGVKGESLTGLDLSGTTHTNAGDYLSDAWTFTDTTGNYNSASSTVHDAISKADPIINFYPLSDKTYGDTPFDVSATATSGLPVSFSASGTCTVSGSTVTITGAGSCTITASQAGNDDYNAATPVSQAFNIIKAQLTITADNASRAYGDANPALTGTIVGIKNSDGITATYSTSAVVTSPVGEYSIVPAVVDSYPSNMGNYNVTLVNGNLTITKAETTTSLSSSINPSVSGQSVNFTATMSTVAPGAGIPNGTVQFKINGFNFGSPVKLSNGSATSIGNSSLSVGTHTITAEYSGDGNFNSSTSLALIQTVNKASNNIPTTTTTSSSAGGSTGNSGCGSGVISKENFSNIKQYETREVNVHISEGATVFHFATLGIVNESGFTAKTNEGCIAARGEDLKERPSQAASDAPGTGTVYFNIWLGPWGYGESSKIENPYVVFSVPDEKNNESVKLMMYKNNSWIDLKTEKIDTGTYRAYTGEFGSFAIVETASPDETPSEISTSPAPTPLVITNGRVPPKPTNLSLILVVLILIGSILIGYRRYRKGFSRKKVNPKK